MLRLICFALVAVVLHQLAGCNVHPLDDTDNHATGQRSNMRVLVDHGTGCQYLSTAFDGVTPRLDKQGKPMCGGER